MIYLIGDVHGEFRAIKQWLETTAKKGDTLIQVGDFGCGFIHPLRIKSLGGQFKDKGCELLVIRGNHDDPSFFEKEQKIDGITFLPDYTKKKIEGETFLFVGGAISVDRCYRTEGFDWWRGEPFSLNEKALYFPNDLDINRVITHSCPSISLPVPKTGGIVDAFSKVDPSLRRELNREQDLIQQLWEKVSLRNKIKTWHFGHFHVSFEQMVNDTKFQCLNINEVIELV